MDMNEAGAAQKAKPSLDGTAREFGRRSAARLFEGRKGHGGGPCSYRTLRPPELSALLAAAFEAGVRYAGAKAAAGDASRPDQAATANIG